MRVPVRRLFEDLHRIAIAGADIEVCKVLRECDAAGAFADGNDPHHFQRSGIDHRDGVVLLVCHTNLARNG